MNTDKIMMMLTKKMLRGFSCSLNIFLTLNVWKTANKWYLRLTDFHFIYKLNGLDFTSMKLIFKSLFLIENIFVNESLKMLNFEGKKGHRISNLG